MPTDSHRIGLWHRFKTLMHGVRLLAGGELQRLLDANGALRDTVAQQEKRLAKVDEKLQAGIAQQERRLSHIDDALKKGLVQHEQRLNKLHETIQAGLTKQQEWLATVHDKRRAELVASHSVVEFDRLWESIQRYIDADDPSLWRRVQNARDRVRSISDVGERICDVLCERDVIHYRDASLRFINRRALWTVIREVLINEEYYFEHPNAAPRIIDGGTNFGLSLYYFKHLYPDARITGFEPAEDLRDMAMENVKRNGWKNVEILPYALSGEDGMHTFFNAVQDRLGGSLTERKRRMGDEVVEQRVECRRLSPYLDEPVDLLKLDIEGSEREVIPEIHAQLGNVQHIVCEYHVDPEVEPEQLGRTIDILEKAGFYVHVDKSDSFSRATVNRPMSSVHKPVSLVIWAKRRNDEVNR